MSEQLIWKEKELRTIGEIGDALCALESRDEAQEFMKAYSAVNVHAYVNVGYISGYYDSETMLRIQDWCETAHPVFGRTAPTPEEAFSMGQRMIQEAV